MFKIEVEVNGETFGHYWMNKHEDDFLQFIPAQFTATYGEVITKENLTVYKFPEQDKNLLEGKINQHEKNTLDCSDSGKIKVCRHDSEFLTENWYNKEYIDDFKKRREEIFSNSSSPVTVPLPAESVFDFGAVISCL